MSNRRVTLSKKKSTVLNKIKQNDTVDNSEYADQIINDIDEKLRFHENEDGLNVTAAQMSEVLSTSITLMSYQQMKDAASVEITKTVPTKTVSGSTDMIGTVNDPRLGSIKVGTTCSECQNDYPKCPGHLGIIKINRPRKEGGGFIYHPSYLRIVTQILNSVCSQCGALRISKKSLESDSDLKGSGLNKLKAISAFCLKLQSADISCTDNCEGSPTYSIVTTNEFKNKKINAKVGTIETDFPASKAFEILDSISEADAKTLGFNTTHPRDFILRALPVIPTTDRQPGYAAERVTAHDLTILYDSIVETNLAIIHGKKKGGGKAPTDTEALKYMDELFDKIADLIQSQNKSTNGDRKLKRLKDMIQGKDGLIRNSSMGKRVNFAGRTVIGPDPTLRMGEIGVPREMAKVLTVPVKVYALNIKYLQKLLNPDDNDNGDNTGKEAKLKEPSHINYIINLRGIKIKVDEKIRKTHILKYGEIVFRWLQDGDYVVWNRQPTLHKYGMMGFRARLRDYSNFGARLEYAKCFNFDHDGDEGNVHVFQSLEATAEAQYLAGVDNCIINAQVNAPIVAASYDVLVAAYLITDPSVIIKDIDRYISMITNPPNLSSYRERLAKYNMNPNSGRSLMSALFPADFYYRKGDVWIQEGILIDGRITKAHIGASHGSIIQALVKSQPGEEGVKMAMDFLTDLPFLLNEWYVTYGFTVSLEDCLPGNKDISSLVKREFENAQIAVMALGPVPDDPVEADRHEEKIKAIAMGVKSIGDKLLKNGLPDNNPLRIMVKSGAKGDEFNLAQIIALLGQQFFLGKRMQPGIDYNTRTLPKFDSNSRELQAYGFIVHSFSEGLDQDEFFFHTAASREGLIDTAMKTSETGSMHHRIVKALENVKIEYDGSVRDSNQRIYQFVYGNDGMDPKKLISINTSEGIVPSWIDFDSLAKRFNQAYSY